MSRPNSPRGGDGAARRSRRQLLAFAAGSMLLLGAAQAAAAEGACYDPEALPLSQRSRRRSLGYRDTSDDPVRRCGACNFFTAAQPGCGACGMLSGAPVNAGAVCNAFAAKAKP